MAMMRRKSRVSGEIPTASMADIAFLLLFFFLVTTVFDEEKGLSLVLPEAETEVAVSQENVLHLVVLPTGVVEVRRGESPRVSQFAADDLATIWRTEFAQNPNLIAAVQTHPQASYRHMIDVLDQLKAAGAERISLQVLEE